MHSVSCFGIPTYKTGRGKGALEHGDMARNWKWTLVLVYCVQQWKESWKLFVEMWSINDHQDRNNSTLEGWNCKTSIL
jgi:hypothetical protein